MMGSCTKALYFVESGFDTKLFGRLFGHNMPSVGTHPPISASPIYDQEFSSRLHDALNLGERGFLVFQLEKRIRKYARVKRLWPKLCATRTLNVPPDCFNIAEAGTMRNVFHVT
jgi:hypothetical protein